MNQIKRIILFAFTMILMSNMVLIGQIKVVASASMFHDMTENIAGDLIDLKSIVPIGSDPHLYEPIPKDAQAVSEADLILVNGLTFEGWINELIENSGTKAKVITITEGIDVVGSLDYEDSFDPHAWMSARNGLVYIDNITKALIEADPSNESQYLENARSYSERIKTLDSYIRTAIESIPRDQRVLVTSHDAFQYYGQEYGLKLEAIMGISTESDAQTSDLIRVTEAIGKFNVPAIFVESTINPAMMQQIAKDNKVEIGGELYADSLGEPEGEAGTYYDMLKHNTDIIVAGLKKPMSTVSESNPEKESNFLSYALIAALLLAGFLFVVYKMNK